MRDLTAEGDWHFAGDAEAQFHTRVHIAEQAIDIALPRQSIETKFGPDATKLADGGGAGLLPTVIGELRDAHFAEHHIALFAPRVIQRSLSHVVLRPEWGTLGRYVPSEDAFIELRLSFDWLLAWLSPVGLVDWRTDRLALLNMQDVELGSSSLAGARVRICTSHEYKTSEYGIEAKRNVQIRVELEAPSSWEELRFSWIRPIQDLLIIALGRPVSLVDAWVRPPDVHPAEGLVQAISALNQKVPEINPRAAAVSGYASAALLGGEEFLETFSERLPGWLRVSEAHREAITRMNAASYARSMYLENECALVTQALESLHSDVFEGAELPKEAHRERVARIREALERADDVPEQDRTWAGRVLQRRNDKSFGERVDDVAELSGELRNLLDTRLPGFAKEVEGLRHSVSHGGGRRKDEPSIQARLERRHYIKELTLWVLRVALLQQAGFSKAGVTAAGSYRVGFLIERVLALDAAGENA